MDLSAHWIWINNEPSTDKKICNFRRTFSLSHVPPSFFIRVSADSRYFLHVNGCRVMQGPCKGDAYRQYYETVDISPYLRQGKNIIAAMVVYFPNEKLNNMKFLTGPISVVSTSRAGFLVAEDERNDYILGISTDERWKVWENTAYIFTEAELAKYAGDMEQVDGNLFPFGWDTEDFCDTGWEQAAKVCSDAPHLHGGVVNQWVLREREIPVSYEKEIGFSRVVKSGENGISWGRVLDGRPVSIPPYSRGWVELDAGELTTAYIRFDLLGGQNAKLTLTYSEAYMQETGVQGKYIKDKRDDAEKGHLWGEKDVYILRLGEQYYEPLFFRTFRFVRVEIETLDQPVTLQKVHLRETGYPLQIDGEWKCRQQDWQKLWDISIRTLRRCMHETYVDCPYYEQMQYTMDTMLQMIFTYQISSDDRLARKAILDFHSSLMPDGMIACNAPAKFSQIIPGFSIFWIMMIRDHYMYFHDMDLVKRYLPTIEQILLYFHSRMDMETGLVQDVGYWQFVDWVEEWQENFGSPISGHERYNTIYNMMYAYGLRIASWLNEEAGRRDTAGQMELNAAKLSEAIVKHTWSDTRLLFRDTPQREGYSQHAQVWAVLAGIVHGEDAKQLMLRCIKEANIAQCSYSTTFFLFRAMEKVGLYSLTKPLWDKWLKLMEKNVTTWPEDPVTQRSECHAWGAIPIYEFAACILGVKPMVPGFDECLIRPDYDYLPHAQGKVATRYGPVSVQWEMGDGMFCVKVKLPCPMKTMVYLPDGSHEVLHHQTEWEVRRPLHRRSTRRNPAFTSSGGKSMQWG